MGGEGREEGGEERGEGKRGQDHLGRRGRRGRRVACLLAWLLASLLACLRLKHSKNAKVVSKVTFVCPRGFLGT